MNYIELNENNVAFLVKIFSNPEYELYFAENKTTKEQWKERLVCFIDKESYIVCKGTSPVGWVMYKVKETICNVDIIVLLDDERHKGYGYEIIHDIIEKNEGLKTIKLDVQKRNIKARKFYEKIGFRVVGTEQQPIGEGITDYYKLQLDI
ncbi:MAG: GNAT family N-acetyltransferase [Oscillospiraceae bacterium]|nr:GNAT family N-acetyltransferase [Oscillospiraceae bacterium]